MRTSPLLADFIHARGCKPICAKLLTLPTRRTGSVKVLVTEKMHRSRRPAGAFWIDASSADRRVFAGWNIHFSGCAPRSGTGFSVVTRATPMQLMIRLIKTPEWSASPSMTAELNTPRTGDRREKIITLLRGLYL